MRLESIQDVKREIEWCSRVMKEFREETSTDETFKRGSQVNFMKAYIASTRKEIFEDLLYLIEDDKKTNEQLIKWFTNGLLKITIHKSSTCYLSNQEGVIKAEIYKEIINDVCIHVNDNFELF